MNFQTIVYPILKPISMFYGWATTLRRRFYQWGILKSYYTPLPSIVIGNLTMGGTGKTPIAQWLLERLTDHKFHPILVTRGYKSKSEKEGLFLASGQTADSFLIGDEPALLNSLFKNKLSLSVGKNRLNMMQNRIPFGAGNLFIWDDGFQHLILRKNASILLFDATVPLKKYQLFPLGVLRESWDAGLGASALVMTKWNLASTELKKNIHEKLNEIFPSIPKYVADYRLQEVVNQKGEVLNKKSEVLAFCGLANNQAFYDLLTMEGYSLKHYGDYPDHYSYPKSMIESVEKLSKEKSLKLVCTQKDWMKISERMTVECFVAKMKLEINPMGHKIDLLDLVLKSIGQGLKL